jgi:hypothetical protein
MRSTNRSRPSTYQWPWSYLAGFDLTRTPMIQWPRFTHLNHFTLLIIYSLHRSIDSPSLSSPPARTAAASPPWKRHGRTPQNSNPDHITRIQTSYTQKGRKRKRFRWPLPMILWSCAQLTTEVVPQRSRNSDEGSQGPRPPNAFGKVTPRCYEPRRCFTTTSTSSNSCAEGFTPAAAPFLLGNGVLVPDFDWWGPDGHADARGREYHRRAGDWAEERGRRRRVHGGRAGVAGPRRNATPRRMFSVHLAKPPNGVNLRRLRWRGDEAAKGLYQSRGRF